MVSKKQKGDSDRWIFYGFLAVLVWAPLPFASNTPWLSSLLGLSIFVLAFWWLVENIRGKVNVSTASKLSLLPITLLLLWLCLLIFQLIFSTTTSPFISSDFLLRSVALTTFFILALVLIRSRRRLKLLAWTIILSGAFQAFYGSVMTLSGMEYGFFVEKDYYREVATGTFVNRNHLAGYLEMSLAVGIGLLLAELSENTALTLKQKIRNTIQWVLSHKMQLRVLLAVMVVGLVLTHSRMGNSAFFISLIVSGVLWLMLEQKKPKRGVIFLLTTLFVIDVAIVGSWFGIEKVAERLEQTSAMSESRDEVVRDSLVYLDDFILTGSGSGTFQFVFPHYRGADIGLDYDYAHNDYIQFAVETGLIGLFLLAMLVIMTMIQSLRLMRKGTYSLHRGMAFASFMAMLALMIHSSVDFNLQIPANALLFMVILSLPWIGETKKSLPKDSASF